ncbi:P110/LppT family adhesin N-terminal domain [Mesomycoplasma dispar]|uniref:Oxidoreductase n=1 Tax=Mesomycoplasma dispar TaxID=86660 RepID=A0ABM6PRU9_9BACT|nr:P110/LppT family adhesin N-terminal domain [Mesomycoplasma dispar]ATP59793.1 oxidoreductase [Mesomycoplasma dispar]
MKKQIRNKVLIVLAGLSFVGITAGVGVGVQKSALRSSYLAQFDNDKSETELQPPINDAELAGVISNFSLKPEWSKISAAQAFKLHKDPLYAFKLSQAVDFSKIDKKFSNLFFNIQVNENTTVEGNAIKNLTVFVFDNITKKEVATRAFKTDLSGFSSVAKEDFIDNFIADSSTYDLDKSLLKTNFATEAVLPSAFSIKFQDQLLTHLRKISPQSFETPKTTQVSAISNLATEFQQQSDQSGENSNGNNQGGSPNQNNAQSGGNSNSNQGGSSSQNNPQSGGNSNDGQTSGGSGGSTQTDGNQNQTDQTGGAGQGQGSETQKPNEETPKEVEPKKEESPSSKLVVSNENLASALADTLKTFGGLKLVAASGLQGLIPNDYTLLPVSSDKSLVKVVADDQAGTAKISLKLLDKDNKEKLIELQITGLSSVGAIKDAISAKITRNQSAYLTLRPQVAEYFKKNQTKNISQLISSFSKHKDKLDGYKKQLGDKYKDKDLIEELLKQLKERQQQTTQQTEEQQVSVSTTSTTEFQQQEQQQSGGNSNGNNQGGSPNQNNGQSGSSSSSSSSSGTQTQGSGSETQSQTQTQGSDSQPQTQSQGSGTTAEKEKNDLVKKFLADFDGASASLFGVFGNNYETFPKDSEGKIIFPDKADFWFDLKDKKLEYQNYKFSFSIPEQKDKNDPNKLTLNLDIHPSQDLKLEVDEKNRQYIDVPEQAQYFEYDKSGKKKIEGVLVPVQTDAASSTETNSVFAQDRRYSGFTFKKWSYPIEIDLRGTKVQQELAKLVGNFHQAELNKKNRYQLFDYDLDKIFKTAKLENWFSLSDAEKNQAKTYLKASLNSISEELELPKKVEEPKVDQGQKQPETPAAPTPAPTPTPAPAAPAPAPNSSTQTQSGNSGSSAGTGTGTQSSGQSSSSQNGSASQSSSGTAAVQSSSSVSVKVQNFQQESTDSSNSSTKEPEKLAFGDYLIKYLDLFSTFKTEQGQKLSLKGEYDRASRTYNFVFAVLDSQNEQVASALFQLHGVNATNVAFTKALPYAPDVFVDGRSGLEYEKDRDKSYVSALSSINNTNVAYVANKKWVEPEKDIDKILKDLTTWSRTPSRLDKNKHNYPEQENEKADDGIKLNFPLRYDYKRENPLALDYSTRERVEKTTLTKGVLYFVFRPEKVLLEKDKNQSFELEKKPYRLLSTTTEQAKSEFGLSSLELFKDNNSDNNSDNNKLKLGWRIQQSRPLNTEFKTLVSSQISAKNLGLVVLEDNKKEENNNQWLPTPKKYEHKHSEEPSSEEPVEIKTTDSKLVNDLQLKQTSPSDSLENYLGKTWLLELQITSNSVVLTIIPEQQTSGGKLKVWRSEIGPRFNSEINKDPETDSGQIFGRGFDFGQIGDFVESNSEEDGDTGQQKTNKPGMTFKALAVFRGDRLLNDATSRNQMRQAFIDQYFKK